MPSNQRRKIAHGVHSYVITWLEMGGGLVGKRLQFSIGWDFPKKFPTIMLPETYATT